MKLLVILISVSILVNCTIRPLNQHEALVKFHTQDLKNFWMAYDKANNKNLSECTQIFDEEYLKKASQGLKDFYELRIQNSELLCKTISKYRQYYEETRRLIPDLNSYSEQIKTSYIDLKKLYPATTNVEVYYLMGRTTTAGTLKDNRMLIGLEMFTSGEASVDQAIVPKHLLPYKQQFKILPQLVAHELIHTQQKYEGDIEKLLELSINEGAADFITKLLLGSTPNDSLYEYGIKNEKKLKKLFKKKMNTKDVSDFLYNMGTNKNPDLGYYMGFRIVEAYYNKQSDKMAAIKNILNVNDPNKFLEESGYFKQ